MDTTPVHGHRDARGSAAPTRRFDRDPFLVFYEATRACPLACRHCRASAIRRPQPGELSPRQSESLLTDLTGFDAKPIVVFTGGDPMQRSDLTTLVAQAHDLGLTPSLAPAATPCLSRSKLETLRDAGLGRVAISLDGPDAASHEALRCIPGSFEMSLHAAERVTEAGLGLQVNTTVTRHNVDRLDDTAAVVESMGASMWSVFFLVPVGRGRHEEGIAPSQYEAAFERLYAASRQRPFAVKTTEAPFYRRYVLQRGDNPQLGPARAPLGVNDGNGVLFVAHDGAIQPSGFLPIECGRFPQDSVVATYRHHPTFRALRHPDGFGGKCGACEFRKVCGGSRARAYAVHGDPLAAEPDCVYQPAKYQPQHN